MTTNILATAIALSDHDLLVRIDALAGTERETTAELVAHLAALELRPSLYAAQGYGSLFAYCTYALRLSEDAACNRIDAARVCRRFPVVLDLLMSGSISLTSVRLLKPHLTEGNHQSVLARATHKGRKEIEALVAELAPRPDVTASVRKLPMPKPTGPSSTASDLPLLGATPSLPSSPAPSMTPTTTAPSSAPSTSRPIVRASAPERYRVQFTIDEDTHDKLRRVQALLRREIPNGDPGLIFGQALGLLLEKVEKAKLGAAARSRPRRVIRPGTDNASRPARRSDAARAAGQGSEGRRTPSRHIPNAIRRAVWRRDAGQCAFVSLAGRRCAERNFLELHHIQPFALNGPATAGNIALRCRRHNRYEAELIFGPYLSP